MGDPALPIRTRTRSFLEIEPAFQGVPNLTIDSNPRSCVSSDCGVWRFAILFLNHFDASALFTAVERLRKGAFDISAFAISIVRGEEASRKASKRDQEHKEDET